MMSKITREILIIIVMFIFAFTVNVMFGNSMIADCEKIGRSVVNTTLIKCEVIDD